MADAVCRRYFRGPSVLQEPLLYEHQAIAIEAALLEGRDVVLCTSTSSGKSLFFFAVILQRIFEDHRNTAFLIYPTKALAQDQLRSLKSFLKPLEKEHFACDFCTQSKSEAKCPLIAIFAFDGDTPFAEREKARLEANVLLTNPDIMHATLLPTSAKVKGFDTFFKNLVCIVLDEAHIYRGIFGAHASWVVRRLLRFCHKKYAKQSPVQILSCSATIHNPLDHYRLFTGRGPLRGSGVPRHTEEAGFLSQNDSPCIVEKDGSPAGERTLVLWNPPLLSTIRSSPEKHSKRRKIDEEKKLPTLPLPAPGARKSSFVELATLVAFMVVNKIRCLAFCRFRVMVELVLIHCRQLLSSWGFEDCLKKVVSYRGGYAPLDRRSLEALIFKGEVDAVICTNALELGIDIGYLDAVITLGFPGSIMSLRQQFGRAGRGTRPSLLIFVAFDSPLDQFCISCPNLILHKDPEDICLLPANERIVAVHLACAAAELPPLSLDEIMQMARLTSLTDDYNCEESIQVLEKCGALLPLKKNEWRFGNIAIRHGLVDFSPIRVTAALKTPDPDNIEEVEEEDPPSKQKAEWNWKDYVATEEQNISSLKGRVLNDSEEHFVTKKIHRFTSLRAIDERRVHVVTQKSLLLKPPSQEGSATPDPIDASFEALIRDATHNRGFPPEETPVSQSTVGGGFLRPSSKDQETVILDEIEHNAAFFYVHPGAIYLNRGREFRVVDLDVPSLTASVIPVKVSYYTQCRDRTDVHILAELGRQGHPFPPPSEAGESGVMGGSLWSKSWGRLRVQTTVYGFYRVDKMSRQIIERVKNLTLPPTTFPTEGCWIDISDELRVTLQAQVMSVRGSLHGLTHALLSVLSLFTLCDPQDVNFECPNINDIAPRPWRALIYDARKGGVGVCPTIFPKVEEMLPLCRDCIANCPCPTGCASCVCSPYCSELNLVMDKSGAITLIDRLLENL